MAKKKENYLDYIPKHNSLYTWEKEDGLVTVKVQNKGFFNRIAQLIFRRPKYSYIHLEEFGSFVWEQIDGKKSIYEIGQEVKRQFGDKCEPLYERLSKYMVTLRNNGYIVYINKMKEGAVALSN